MKEAFYEKNHFMKRSLNDIRRNLLCLESCSRQERVIITQRLTKRQYSPIYKNGSFNRMSDIFRLSTLDCLPVHNILFLSFGQTRSRCL